MWCGSSRIAYPGLLLAWRRVMSVYLYTSERCQEPFAGNTYRVISDGDGVRLLDMIVCYGCFLEASRLGLTSESIETAQAALH